MFNHDWTRMNTNYARRKSRSFDPQTTRQMKGDGWLGAVAAGGLGFVPIRFHSWFSTAGFGLSFDCLAVRTGLPVVKMVYSSILMNTLRIARNEGFLARRYSQDLSRECRP